MQPKHPPILGDPQIAQWRPVLNWLPLRLLLFIISYLDSQIYKTHLPSVIYSTDRFLLLHCKHYYYHFSLTLCLITSGQRSYGHVCRVAVCDRNAVASLDSEKMKKGRERLFSSGQF